MMLSYRYFQFAHIADISIPLYVLFRTNRHQTSKSWPNFSLKDLTKIQLQNFRFNFSLKILTKIQLQNLFKTSKSWPNLSLKVLTKIYLKILTKLQLQQLDQNSGSKSLPNLSFKISTKLSSTRSSVSTSSAALTTSRSFELASSGARVTSVKSTK